MTHRLTHSEWMARRIEDARRDILHNLETMSHDDWSDTLGDLEIVCGWAAATAAEKDEAEIRLCKTLFEDEEFVA